MEKTKKKGARRGRKPSAVNLRAVAKAAGVGLGTASRALNGDFNISAETLKNVHDAARSLGYTLPNPERRPIPAGTGRIVQKVLKSGRLAFLIPDRHPAGLTTLMSRKIEEGISEYFFGRKITLIPACFMEDGSLPPCLADKEVDGFIVRGNLDNPAIHPSIRAQLDLFPRVGVMWSGSHYPIDTVMPDKEQVGRLAAQALVRRGRRHLVCMSEVGSRRDHAQSIFGFMHEAELLGVRASRIVRSNPDEVQMDSASIKNMADELKSLSARPDGIYFVSGQRFLLPVLHQKRIRPSGSLDFVMEVSCTEAMEEYADLPALFVNIHVERVGCAAAEQLLWRIQHPDAELRKVLIEPEIVSRC